MSDLRDLYQELIVDHNKNPRNYGVLADAKTEAERVFKDHYGDLDATSVSVLSGPANGSASVNGTTIIGGGDSIAAAAKA